MSRRLAAIMFTDIAEYTSLSQSDETAALGLLRDQERLVRGLLEVHEGRLVKSMGDGLLIEFSNARNAVTCAADLQRHLHERNTQEPPPALRMRIGIHLGDVEGTGSDILGDAVNIASRIEPLAEPGGVCLSEPVYLQVRSKVPYRLEKLGPQTLKGVREPVEVYRLALPWGTEPLTTPAPTHPRLAVLPLANISPDPSDEYIADGLTEELISVLSQIGGLRVIARTSVIQYKSSPKSIPQVGAELGVSAVLEGSVRKAGDRLRITAQLIDVASQEHTWSASYDRKLDDIFAIQTEVAGQIADELEIKVAASEGTRLREKPTTRPDSYLAYLKGRSALAGRYSPASILQAKKQFELAVAIDPTNARAFSGLADALFWMVWWGGPEGQRSDWDDQARANAVRAVELDPGLAEAHCSLAAILWEDRDYPAAEQEFRKALSLNPSYALAHRHYANLLMDAGRPEEALREIALATELDPQSLLTRLQHNQFLAFLRRAEEARSVAEQIGRMAPDSTEYHSALSMAAWGAQNLDEALKEEAKALERHPHPERRSRHLRVFFLIRKGERDQALPILKDFEQSPARTVFRTEALAGGYALLGDFDRAFHFLDEGIESRALAFQIFRTDPVFEPLRADPRFGQLLQRMKLA